MIQRTLSVDPIFLYNIISQMPKFRVFSDLHLEYNFKDASKRCLQISKQKPVDNLILAGDIVDYKTKDLLPQFVHQLTPYYQNIFYILGNHEFYQNPYNTYPRALDKKIIPRVIEDYRNLCDDLGMILLQDEYCDIDGINIYGTTFWSKLSPKAYIMMNDKNFMNPNEIDKAHEDSRNLLDNYLKTNETPTIVVTHHLPSFKFVAKKYYERNPENGINAGFASNSDDLFRSPITHWIFGHTHVPMNHCLKGINFWCNPYGYPGENLDYDDLVIEV